MSLMREPNSVLGQPMGGPVVPQGHLGANVYAGGGEQPLLKLDVARALQLHKRLAIAIALLGILGAVAYLHFLKPLYTANAIIYMQPVPPKVLDNGFTQTVPFDSNAYETFMKQQMAAVTRRDVLDDAAQKLQAAGSPNVALLGAIEVTRLGTGYAVGARSTDPQMAAKMANAVSAAYIDSVTREAKSGDNERLAILRDERDRLQKELDADREEQKIINQSMGVAGVGATTPNHFDNDIDRVRDQLVKARAATDEASAKLTTVQSSTGSNAALDAEAEQIVAGDPGLGAMKASYFQRRAILTTQMANLTPNHPQYKQNAEELAQINKSIDAMTKDLRAKAAANLQQRLRNDLNRTADMEGRLNSQLGKMTASAASATAKMQRANDLAVDIGRLQNRFTIVNDQLHNLQLELSVPGNAYLAAAAAPPLKAANLGLVRNAVILAVLGILFGIIAAVAVHKFDNKIYIASDIEQVLGFAPMAVLPDFDQVSFGVAEEHILRLTAGIEFARQQGNLKSCIFTGTGPGTGVTTVTGKVRSVLESMGRSTVLMDASGTPPPPARSSANFEDEPGAQRASRSTALVQQVAQEAETQEEGLVLTDTAPLAVSAETEYLSRFVDAAIVVVESGVTTRKELRETAERLQRLDVAAVGFVLNKVNLKTADPDFRNAVKAIDRHQEAQSRSFSRSTERTASNFAANAPKPKPAPEPEPKPQATAPVPPRQASPFITDDPYQPRAAAPVPPRPAAPIIADEPSQPRAAAPSTSNIADLIASLAPQEAPVEPRQTPIPLRSVPPRPASSKPVSGPGVSPVQPAPAMTEPATVHPEGPIPIDLRGRDAAPAAVTPAALDAAINPHPIDPNFRPKPTSWADSWKRFSPAQNAQPPSAPVQPPAVELPPPVFPDLTASATATPDAPRYSWMEQAAPPPVQPKPLWSEASEPLTAQPAPPADEAPHFDAATRMSGLRNLIFSLGMKPTAAEEGTEALTPAPPRPVAPPAEPIFTYAAPEPPAPQAPPASPAAKVQPPAPDPPFVASAKAMPRADSRADSFFTPPTLVTAAPEFLPPKPDPEPDNAGRNRPRGPAARRDSRDSVDEIDTLPSRRGQYRKKP